MKIKTPLWIIGVLLVELVTACSMARTKLSPTPTVFNYAPTPIAQESQFPMTITCSRINTVSRGPSWNGLTIGETTYEQVEEKLSPLTVHWNSYHGYLEYENDSKIPERSWGFFDACFLGGEFSAIGGKLSALNVFGLTEIPLLLEDLIDQYGEPYHVTWGYGYYDRTLIWPSKGILVVYDLLSERRANVILFSPIKKRNYEESWLYNSLPTEGETYEEMIGFDTEFNDSVSLPPEMEVENPWGYGDK